MLSVRLATAVLAMCCLAATANSQHVGGLDAEHPADEHLKGIMKQAMDKLHSSYPGGFKTMEPLSYRTQVVSGKNYFVKVKVTDDGGSVQHAHLRLYRPFTGGIEVHGIKTDENEKSPLKYFQVS